MVCVACLRTKQTLAPTDLRGPPVNRAIGPLDDRFRADTGMNGSGVVGAQRPHVPLRLPSSGIGHGRLVA